MSEAKNEIQLNALVNMPFAYKPGNNPSGENAYYSCSRCGIELLGEDVGYIASGSNYANGEHAPCPNCNYENRIERDQAY